MNHNTIPSASSINFLQGGFECSPEQRWNFESPNLTYGGIRPVKNITFNVKLISGTDVISVYTSQHNHDRSIHIYVNDQNTKYSSRSYPIVGTLDGNNIVKNGIVPAYKIPTVAELLKALKYPYIESNTEPNMNDYLQSPITSTLPPINFNCDERDILNKKEKALKQKEEDLKQKEEDLNKREEEQERAINTLYEALHKREEELKQREEEQERAINTLYEVLHKREEALDKREDEQEKLFDTLSKTLEKREKELKQHVYEVFVNSLIPPKKLKFINSLIPPKKLKNN